MKKIKCVLIDDELPTLGYVQALCRQIDGVEIIKSYTNPLKFMEAMDTLDFDTCILDINMPSINGLELAKALEAKAVIFSTAYKAYAADAFDLDAVDYLRKPYQIERLEKAFDKARIWLSTKAQTVPLYIDLNTHLGKSRIHVHDMAYIVVADNDRRDKEVWFKDGQSLLAKNITLDELMTKLPQDQFCKINRKTIASVSAVSHCTSQWISFEFRSPKNSTTFKLSEQYRDNFMSLFRN